jgi:hypothetical protein
MRKASARAASEEYLGGKTGMGIEACLLVCPQCGARFDPEAVLKRAGARVAVPEKQVEPAVPDEVEEEEVAATEGDLIEDAAELGDDEEAIPGKSGN